MRRMLLCLGMLAGVLGISPAVEPIARTIVVSNGSNDLTNVLVSVPMAGVELPPSRVTSVKDAAGHLVPHQFLPGGLVGPEKKVPRVLVLLDTLKANEVRTLTFLAGPLAEGTRPSKLGWEHPAEDTIELRVRGNGERPIARFTRFQFDSNAAPKERVLTNPTIKPYHHVFDPAGETRLTNANEGRFPHHRGIFYGFNQISYRGKKADIWHCRNGEHTQAEKEMLLDAGDLLGQHRFDVSWNGQDGQPFAREQRELLFVPLKDGLLVEFRSLMTTDDLEGVKLDGDPQHAGFHFRAHANVEESAKQTYFLRPDGPGKPGEERNWDPRTKEGPVNLPWNAMCFELAGKKRTVVYLDHPNNPKEARQSERTYGRIGTYFVHELTPRNPLFVKYRLWIQNGEMTVEQCEMLSKAFTETANVEVK